MTNLILKNPELTDLTDFIAATNKSIYLHYPWISAPKTKLEYEEYLQRCSQPDHLAYLIIKSHQLVGVINFNNIIRGVFQNAFLGYYVMAGYEKQGLMYQGLKIAIRLAFTEHQLHRLEANIQPENIRSINLAKQLGFHKEGFSPKYLKINNEWKDHERWAISAEEYLD